MHPLPPSLVYAGVCGCAPTVRRPAPRAAYFVSAARRVIPPDCAALWLRWSHAHARACPRAGAALHAVPQPRAKPHVPALQLAATATPACMCALVGRAPFDDSAPRGGGGGVPHYPHPLDPAEKIGPNFLPGFWPIKKFLWRQFVQTKKIVSGASENSAPPGGGGGGLDWAPRTRKRHQQEHRPQRPTERSDPTQHAKGRTGDCPGPRKGATTRRNVTQGAGPPPPPPPFKRSRACRTRQGQGYGRKQEEQQPPPLGSCSCSKWDATPNAIRVRTTDCQREKKEFFKDSSGPESTMACFKCGEMV